MREPVNVFYYPDMASSDITLKKAILFFDEIHFMDRGSFFFGGGQGQVGTIGAASPLRAYEHSFREHGVPLYVHDAKSGPLQQNAMNQVASDINDPGFLSRFQEGLKTSEVFRDLQIAPGNYGESGTHEDLARQLIGVELSLGLKDHPGPSGPPHGWESRAFQDPNASRVRTGTDSKGGLLLGKDELCSQDQQCQWVCSFCGREPLWKLADKQVSARDRRGTQGAADDPAYGPGLRDLR